MILAGQMHLRLCTRGIDNVFGQNDVSLGCSGFNQVAWRAVALMWNRSDFANSSWVGCIDPQFRLYAYCTHHEAEELSNTR